MRMFIFLFCCLACSVCAKSNVKALTESMGQEIIEIGNPIKELPPDLEEEPSAEAEDDDEKPSSTLPPARKETKSTTRVAAETTKLPSVQMQQTTAEVGRKGKDPTSEEEMKVEKELAEIYKDTEDYKIDSSEVGINVSVPMILGDKPIARARSNFKFQPDRINQKEVERFRTSIDEISCDRSVTKKMAFQPDGASSLFVSAILLPSCLLLALHNLP